MKSNLLTRAISGIIYVGIIVLSCLLGYYGIISLAIIVGALAIIEYKKMFSANGGNGIHILLFDIIAVASIIIPFWGIAAAIIALVIRMIMTIYDKESAPQKAFMTDVAGIVYIAVPLACMSTIAIMERSGMLILAIFIMIWLNDTGAFCIGSLWGSHKMYPRISPKKSWEGLVGGITFSVGFGILLGFTKIWHDGSMIYNSPLFWILTSLIVAVSATYGDLFESTLKRNLGIKDSGNLIPGHGGILDRIDSLLMVMPTMLIFLLLWKFCV